jgi:ActR/RegA family two-component response regulator
MAAKKTKGTVLILDDDLGFAVWLGATLNEAGFRALPANTTEEALEIAGQVEPAMVHMVIANLAVVGSGELIDKIASKNKSLKVMAIGNSAARRVHGSISRPRGKALPAAKQYVEAVLRVLQ